VTYEQGQAIGACALISTFLLLYIAATLHHIWKRMGDGRKPD
jgi:hypothetical protein